MLTKKEIIKKLKSMEVGEGKELPIKSCSFLIINNEYDPSNFSQAIEDGEKEVDLMGEIIKEMNKPEFDWVWNNTIGNIKTNSDKWYANHTKKCKIKLEPNRLFLTCKEYSGGTRNYYSEENLKRILDYAEEVGGIIDFT